MEKTALEWFAQLPEPIRSQAVENWEKYKVWHEVGKLYNSLDMPINSFSWAKTSQGFRYWSNICIRAKSGEFDQPEPNLHGWISVADRLPTQDDGGTDFLVLVELSLGYEYQIAEWFDAEDGETPLSFNIHDTWSGQNQIEREIKYWQPLPKLPEVKGGSDA